MKLGSLNISNLKFGVNQVNKVFSGDILVWEKEVPSFEFTIKTDNLSTGSSNDNQFKLPLVSDGTIDFVVDWGDGSIDNITVWNQVETTHTYSSIGTYNIKIRGNIRGWVFIGTGDRLKMLNVSKISALNITIINAFYGCSNMTWTATDAPIISTASLTQCFRDCILFNGNIGNWDVSSVTNMQGMFDNARAFNQPIGSWDVSNVTNMQNMFNGCSVFNQPIGNWDVSNVTNMQSMFRNTSSFNQPIENWDVSNVTNMSQMVRSATAFNQPIGDWDISSVTNFTNFMLGKAPTNYDASYLDDIYNKWSLLTVQPNLNINFGSIKYTAAGQAGKDILLGPPNNWTITDGGV
jgi:surface protein